MKQAILITAYKNYNHLEEIINFLMLISICTFISTRKVRFQ